MNSGLQASGTAIFSTAQPLLAQFGGGKNYYVDLVLIVVLFGVVVFLVGRSSRRF